MGKESFWCWVCEYEGCGHIWIKRSDAPPEKCAKCRRRGWNVKHERAVGPADANEGQSGKGDDTQLTDEELEQFNGDGEEGF